MHILAEVMQNIFLQRNRNCLRDYTTVSISKAVSKIDNSIYIINGSCDTTAIESAKLYKSLNPAIESVTIENAKHYPQIEQPLKFIKNIDIFLS